MYTCMFAYIHVCMYVEYVVISYSTLMVKDCNMSFSRSNFEMTGRSSK